MNEQNEIRRAAIQEGFVIGCIVSSLLWWIFL
jgi:hypothetical protein